MIDTYLRNKPNFANDLFEKILEKYESTESGKHRIDSFRKNATNILGYLGLYSKFSIYPPKKLDEYTLFISMSKALEEIKVPLRDKIFDFDEEQMAVYHQKNEIETFRFIDRENFSEESVTLPIDKIVSRLVKEKL